MDNNIELQQSFSKLDNIIISSSKLDPLFKDIVSLLNELSAAIQNNSRDYFNTLTRDIRTITDNRLSLNLFIKLCAIADPLCELLAISKTIESNGSYIYDDADLRMINQLILVDIRTYKDNLDDCIERTRMIISRNATPGPFKNSITESSGELVRSIGGIVLAGMNAARAVYQSIIEACDHKE